MPRRKMFTIDQAKGRAVAFCDDGIAREFPVAIIDLERGVIMRPVFSTLTYELED